MKKILAGLTMAVLALSANAQHHGYHPYGHRHSHGGGGWGWVAPAVIGGAVAYAITRPAPPPVVIQQAPVVQQQPTVVYIDGVAYSKQWMQINGQWQEVLVRI